ncbi:alpha-amylase [Flavobacterium akiainvivens]|uniref:Alpha-amylase n=1 Tax=Flavobacterium akiainvivens TaxID=1202724 RepID=A0A0M8MBL0_9FLAO|nr:alpha-amylase family glycosyl hydrolase [Flavobacterium akiainvivens]KOS06695.1 alpha-amylase [Flavobacterium akiainvivens]SFQ70955.1 Por secretion system C-terminal sorting domain-containing protein [Flavobacterium akiainvivens]
MRKITLLLLFILTGSAFGQVTLSPDPADPNGPVTLFFDKAGTGLESYTGTIYAHMGLTVDGQQWQSVIGNWGENNIQPALTFVSGTTYKLEMPTSLYSYFNVPTTSTITQICLVLRSASSPYQQTGDFFETVGVFQVNLTAPLEGSTTIINNGAGVTVSATNTGGNAAYTLKANGTDINTNAATASYSYTHANVTANTHYELVVTQGDNTITKDFTVIVNPNAASQAMPAGVVDGINYNDADNTKATLVLNAPGKDFVYVAGSFNNWTPTSAHAMKKDPATGKFWLELTGLSNTGIETFQYWVVDQTPVANSQALVKTADPFSHMLLSQLDDQYIPESVYPGLPEYPQGQSFEVSVINTTQQAYDWQVTDFVRPAKEDLVIYEALIRDFNSTKTWESMSAQIDYFKNLHINAIELMPVMEFEGNISWGYNTAYHMAPDKAYGTPESMKAFIDLCHENGIAVILDVALNHVYGRSPLARMWSNDPDGDGFGIPATDNPYCNVTAKHSYSVGSDLNHSTDVTRYYVERTIEYWMTEYNIDGFRWDLTKGFTQNCTENGDTCTNSYQADRVAVLKQYADMQWAIDPDFYIIFEHMGDGSGPNSAHQEEIEWANYRLDEGKGIMLWEKHTDAFNQNTMGYAENSNFNNMDFENQGYPAPRAVNFAESHDEERLMYKNLLYGNQNGSYSAKNLATALDRTKTLGAVFLTIPGPKMMWQFEELGYDYGINYCEDGTYSNDCRTNPKPIPMENGYSTDPARMAVYNTWAQILNVKTNNAVFSTSTFTVASGNLTPRIDIWDESLPADALRNVIVLANFDVTAKTVNTSFPYTGTWYNLMDNTTISGDTQTITLQPGEYRIMGNQAATMGNEDFTALKPSLYPNPANGQFSLSIPAQRVEVYAITGQLVKTYGANAAGNNYDISGLNAGIYMIKITGENNAQSTIKLIKE